MRTINKDCLQEMTSPIKVVMDLMERSVINIVPEKAIKFQSDFPDLHIQYFDSPKMIANSDSVSKTIRVSSKLIEVLWCSSYTHFLFYSKYLSGKLITSPSIVNLHEDRDMKGGCQLLTWVIGSALNPDNNDTWPPGLPRPRANPPKDSILIVADEICLCAMAFIFHHELAHIVLKHQGGSTIDQEREADRYAADFIMSEVSEQDGMIFTKRAFGICVALFSLVTLGLYTGDYGGVTHPKHYDRLFNTLSDYVQNENHLVWSFLTGIFKLHFDNAGIKVDDKKIFDSFLECVNCYIDLLSTSDA